MIGRAVAAIWAALFWLRQRHRSPGAAWKAEQRWRYRAYLEELHERTDG